MAKQRKHGMPWYQRSERFEQKKREQASDFSDLTREETREIVKGAMKASLLIAGVFILAMLLFILFCLYVWF